MVISEEKIAAFDKRILKEFKSLGMPEEIHAISVSYGNEIADHILTSSAKDN